MFDITKNELEHFRTTGSKILKIVTLSKDENPARKWYKYKNPVIQAFNYAIILLCEKLPPCEFKNNLYRMMGAKIGKNVSIANDCILDTIYPELILIEDNVIIGWGSKLYTHEFTQDTARIGTIHFKKKSMLGEWSVVRPGVCFGNNSLVAAMSFVNRDVPDDFVEGGVPIHVIHYNNEKHINRKKVVKKK
jgi:acetyltransferase-like isoleucine patch superfamily enzyme